MKLKLGTPGQHLTGGRINLTEYGLYADPSGVQYAAVIERTGRQAGISGSYPPSRAVVAVRAWEVGVLES